MVGAQTYRMARPLGRRTRSEERMNQRSHRSHPQPLETHDKRPPRRALGNKSLLVMGAVLLLSCGTSGHKSGAQIGIELPSGTDPRGFQVALDESPPVPLESRELQLDLAPGDHLA